MIKTLQKRFILITMASISLVFALILLVLNISVNYSARHQGYAILHQYAQRQFPNREPKPDSLPKPPEDKELSPADIGNLHWFNRMRISYVFYDTEGNITDLSTGQDPDMTEENLCLMAENILPKDKENGSQSGYLYHLQKSEEGTYIYFLDYSPEKDMSMRLFEICLWVGLAGIFVILIPVIILSRWVTKPVQLAFDKQRQFIADASHELKTPLTIITTNAEVLQNNISDNKWLSYILEQSSRMKILINNLLELAKLDAYSNKQDFRLFDLSRAVKNASLSFESLAYEYQKQFIMEIEESVLLHGSENSIKQLVTILLDNAFKYSGEKGIVQISLTSHGDKKELIVHNTGSGIPTDEQKYIFERFYRYDSSRSRQSGGYGLGLSIAKSISDAHKGHIHVKSDGETYTNFIIILP